MHDKYSNLFLCKEPQQKVTQGDKGGEEGGEEGEGEGKPDKKEDEDPPSLLIVMVTCLFLSLSFSLPSPLCSISLFPPPCCSSLLRSLSTSSSSHLPLLWMMAMVQGKGEEEESLWFKGPRKVYRIPSDLGKWEGGEFHGWDALKNEGGVVLEDGLSPEFCVWDYPKVRGRREGGSERVGEGGSE